jgi:thiamine-monophosphate kinase
VDYALSGGDDYEILFTVPPDRAPEVASLPATLPVCTQIGVIASGSSVECRRSNQPYTVQRLGFDHFAKDVRA